MDNKDRFKRCANFAAKHGKRIIFPVAIVHIVAVWLFFQNRNSKSSHFDLTVSRDTSTSSFKSIYNVYHMTPPDAKEMRPFYSEPSPDIWCFQRGIDVKKTLKDKKCVCSDYWHGLDCGIPAAIWKSNFLSGGGHHIIKIERRKIPRRIIASLVIENEYDLLEINIENSLNVVDLFLIISEKQFHFPLLIKLKEKFTFNMHSKIITFQVDTLNQFTNFREWAAYMLGELWSFAWTTVSEFRPDDIFVFLHVSSIVSEDVLQFLKFYDGYPEPLYFNIRSLLFTFWKEIKQTNSNMFIPFSPSACTFQFMASMCNYKVLNFLNNHCLMNEQLKISFEKNHWPLEHTVIGNEDAPSGWQCNLFCKNNCTKSNVKIQMWFFKNGTISLKNLKHANASVMEHILQHNFNDKNLSIKIISSTDYFFAPRIVLNKSENYVHFIN